MQTVTWSNASIPEWQKYTLGAPDFLKVPEGYVIIEMYNTSRNKSYQPERGGVLINGENCWDIHFKNIFCVCVSSFCTIPLRNNVFTALS